jgi:hypothetical protein
MNTNEAGVSGIEANARAFLEETGLSDYQGY